MSATGCVGFSRSKEFGDSGNRGIVDDVVVTTCSVVVRGTDGALAIDVPDGEVLDVVVLDVVVVVDVVVELTAAETERDVRGPS